MSIYTSVYTSISIRCRETATTRATIRALSSITMGFMTCSGSSTVSRTLIHHTGTGRG